MKIEVGQKASYERSFTVNDVELFAELSGDKGEHHLRADKEGRIMLHGLLTATVPTKLGGDMNYIAREISYEFLRPVFAGDKVRADAVVTKVEQSEGHQKVAMDFVCYNQHGKEVMRGRTNGIIRT
ncbi:MAG TPA: MaoC/PaaZ C-terminal domain-containing protein [Nitrososphaerales archaeon]|nr:MaoC/PaaZ C-terminal domain-containing protein [Nitrososphaerales archaeon]